MEKDIDRVRGSCSAPLTPVEDKFGANWWAQLEPITCFHSDILIMKTRQVFSLPVLCVYWRWCEYTIKQLTDLVKCANRSPAKWIGWTWIAILENFTPYPLARLWSTWHVHLPNVKCWIFNGFICSLLQFVLHFSHIDIALRIVRYSTDGLRHMLWWQVLQNIRH